MKVAVIFNKRESGDSDVINIFGPQTKERYNPKTVERVAAALEKAGHNVKVIEGNMHVVDELRAFMPRVIAGERPGMVFNMAYGIQGQSRYTHLPAMLEMLGVPYVGSGPGAHAVALDKVMTKIVLQRYDLPTPRFWVFSSSHENFDHVEFPVIVKPKMEAVSMGIRVVENVRDLRDAVKEIVEGFQQQALVEAFVAGREFAVGLLGNSPVEILPIVEFDLGNDPFAIQTQSAKMKYPVQKICPAEIPEELAEEMRRLAREAFRVLDIYDFARIDIRMGSENRLYILELNSMASLGFTGSYVHAAKVAGYSYESLVNRMLDVAAVRYLGESYLEEATSEDAQREKTYPLRARIRAHLRANLTTMEDYLRRMSEMDSYVHNAEGVNALGNWISNRLAQYGFRREVFPQVEVGNNLYFANHEGDTNDILILSHLDSPYRYQDQAPLREEGGKLIGSGVAESKGGLASMIGAIQALRFARRLRRVRCGILLTTDNSIGGRLGRKIIKEKARISKCVVGLKYGDVGGGIVTSCSGRALYRIEMKSIKIEGGNVIPDVILTMCRKMVAWQKLSDPEAGLEIKAFRLDAHTTLGDTPDYAVVSLIVRFKDAEQGERLDERIRRIAKKGKPPGLRLQVIKSEHRPPVNESPKSSAFYERVSQLAKKLEVRVEPVYRFASSDVGYVPQEIPALDGLGPVGAEARSPNEYILRDSLIDRGALLAMIVRDCAKQER